MPLKISKPMQKLASMKRGQIEAITKEAGKKVARRRDYADDAGVNPAWRDQIQTTLRLQKFI